MKTSRVLLLSLALVAGAASASAAFQSAQPLPGNISPQFPATLVMEGITRGRAYIAVSLDETGRVKDMLPLAYSNVRFARVSMDALREWRFAPAQLDGQPVPVQTELSFEYTLEGAVITTNFLNHFLFDNFDNIGDYALIYRPGQASHLDRAPVRLSGETPKYAVAAAKDGVRGRVEVRFYIDENGAVRQPAVSSAANPYLAEQAVEALRTWKFEPATSRGRPVLVTASQEFNFDGGR